MVLVSCWRHVSWNDFITWISEKMVEDGFAAGPIPNLINSCLDDYLAYCGNQGDDEASVRVRRPDRFWGNATNVISPYVAKFFNEFCKNDPWFYLDKF